MLPARFPGRCILLLSLLLPSSSAFVLRPSSSTSAPCQPCQRHHLSVSMSTNNNNNGGEDPFAIRILQPNQLRIIRVIGEQRLTIEEETEKRDGAGPRGAFGRIRNKKSTAGQPSPQISREMKNMGVGVRLFEAVDSTTGERLIMKEFLPMMRNVAMGEVELYRY